MAVCGDDYIGCHTYATYRRYLDVRSLTGAVGSPGKDILGTQSTGVFAEELVTVGRCRWVPTVSVRSVLGDPKSGVAPWQQGPEVSQSLAKIGWTRQVSARVCGKLHKLPISILRRSGIDPFAPRWVGGAGFPGIPSHASLVKARRMMSQAREQITTWVTAYEMAWTTSCSSSLLTSAVSDSILRNSEFQWDTGRPGEWGPLRDVVASRLGTLSWPYFLAGASQRELRVSIRSVSERLRSVSGEIASRGYWVSPLERIVRGEGLADALDAIEPQVKPIPYTPILRSIRLNGTSADFFLARKQPSGPGTPDWGPRKRARLV